MRAERQIAFFKQRFDTDGEGHFIFACHAAFPVFFTPDLLYRLWLNFNRYPEKTSSEQGRIDHVVVSDLLLSNLCHEIGFELYEMDKTVRSALLNELRNDSRFGQQRIARLADFLYQYAAIAYKDPNEQHFKDTHQWTALAISQPQQAVMRIGEALSHAVEQEKTGELLRLYTLLETFVQEDNTFDQLFEFSKGIKEHVYGNTDYVVRMPVLTTAPDEKSINLLTLPIPESLRGKIQRSRSHQERMIANKIQEAQERNDTTLDLSNMGLSTIPWEVYSLSQLQVLNVSHNNIRVFPSEIKALKQLQELNLKNNQITQLPQKIIDLDLEIKWENDGQGGIILIGNPLETPPIGIIKRGRKVIQAYYSVSPDDEELETALEQLDALVGLEQIKEFVYALIEQVSEKQDNVLPVNMVFTGYPGTGKRTVAMLIGRIFRALHIFKKGHLIIHNASLTELSVSKATFEEAVDGILFIDEPYKLSQNLGQETIETLLHEMEKYRHRLLVILAGYPGEIRRFLEGNPEFRSHFTQHLEFPEYSPDNLIEILQRMSQSEGLQLSPAAARQARLHLQALRDKNLHDFDNVRAVENLLSQMRTRMTVRVAKIKNPTESEAITFKSIDVPQIPGQKRHTTKIRKACHARTFYPTDEQSCRQQIEECLGDYQPPVEPKRVVAGIVCHAGWLFSGPTAARVFKSVKVKASPETILIFGSVHIWGVGKAAMYHEGAWETPLGTVDIDEDLANMILEQVSDKIEANPSAHEREHSIEVHVPFFQYLFPYARILPIMIPPVEDAAETGQRLGKILAEQQKQVFVLASSDFNLYGPIYGRTQFGIGLQALEAVKKNDQRLIDLAVQMKAEEIVPEVEINRNACGAGAIAATVAAARELGAERGYLLGYATNHDIMPNPQEQNIAAYVGIIF